MQRERAKREKERNKKVIGLLIIYMYLIVICEKLHEKLCLLFRYSFDNKFVVQTAEHNKWYCYYLIMVVLLVSYFLAFMRC